MQPSNPSTATATFGFTASDPDDLVGPLDTETAIPAGITLACSLDGAPATDCTPPTSTTTPRAPAGVTYTALAAGTHTFTVSATDDDGTNSNTGATSYTWTVDTTAPTVTLTAEPSDPSTTSTATFAFTATDPDDPPSNITFACGLEAVTPTACSSPTTYTGLPSGAHTFSVTATDVAGNSGNTKFTWHIQ